MRRIKIRGKMPKVVPLGLNFVVRCLVNKPKKKGAPVRYWFSLEPVNKKKFRSYAALNFPGASKVSFVEVVA